MAPIFKFIGKIFSFFANIFRSGSQESSKRVIAFICIFGLLYITKMCFRDIDIKPGNKDVILEIVSVFKIIVLFVFGYVAIEKIQGFFKKDNNEQNQ